MQRLFALLLLFLPTAALAEPTFVPGGRLGLDLPPGFGVASGFPGFENLQTGATFLMVERPREAWSRLRGSFTDTNLKEQGIEVKSREAVKIGDSEAVLLSGIQTVGPQKIQKYILIVGDMTVTPLVTFQVPPEGASQYPADLVRKSLMSLQIRAPVTMSEQVAALPFSVGDISGYHVDRTIEGKAAIIAADPADTPAEPPPVFVVVAMQDRMPTSSDMADAFARQGLATLSTASDFNIETQKTIDINGVPSNEIVASAVDKQSQKPIVIVQTLRPLPEGTLRYVGIGPAATRDKLLADFERLRGVIAPKTVSGANP